MSSLKDLTKTVINDLSRYAKIRFKTKSSELLESLKSFVTAISKDMERWLKLFAKGKLTRDEVSWLLIGKKELLELEFLNSEGTTLLELGKTRDDLVQVILKSALSLMV